MPTAGIPTAPPRARPLITFAVLGAGLSVLLALAWMAATRSPPPSARPAAPPALDRMMRHVSVLAAAPRPIATPANARARGYLLGQLRDMGVAASVQKTTVQKTTIRYWGGTSVTLGVVHNIVARLPGSAPEGQRRPALLLAAHYDSGDATLGAARGAAQAAAMLETARALRAGPAHANDIVLLFADGEDVGGLGAKGFAEQHPLAGRVGLTLKFDAAGSAGPLVLMDATGAGGDALRGWTAAVPEVDGSSLKTRLYKLLPDTPRVGPLRAIDAPALLFVNSGRRFAGRSGDSIERLDPAMLAQLGSSMLRLARHFGDAPLARGAHQPRAYFSLPLAGGVQHSAILCWGLGALACLMLVRAYGREHEQSGGTVAPLVQGFFGMALILLAARMLLWERREELAALTRMDDAGPALVFLAAGGCLFVGALYLLRRLVGATPVFLGAMAWLALALLLSLLWTPDAAWLLAWPLATALAAFTALQAQAAPSLRLAILAAGLAPVPLLFVPALRDAWTAFAPYGLYLPALLIAVAMLCFASLLLLLPLGRVVMGASALAFAGCLALPGQASAPPQEARHAALEPNRLVYFKDMNSWRAYWLLRADKHEQPLDPWTKGLFPNLDKPSIYVDVFGWHSPRQWFAIAPRDDGIAFPEAFMLKNPALAKPSLDPGLRQVEFTLRSKNRAPHIKMWVAGTKPWRSTLNGRVLTAKESRWSLSLYGMEDQLLRFTIDAPADDILAVMVEERMPGLPEHLLPPGAPPRMPGTGTTVSADVLRFY